MTDIIEALEAGDQLQSLMDEALSVVPTKGLSGIQRKQAHQVAIESVDDGHLLNLMDKMTKAIDQILANKIDLAHLSTLSPEELHSLMVEFLDQRDIKELIEVRYNMIRAAVFGHITAINKAKGTKDPEFAPDNVPVEDLGKKFVRQGGKAKAILDYDKLRELLGPERWEQVCKAEIKPAVPEHVEYKIDNDAMLKLVMQDPSVLEQFRECVIPGPRTPLSFHVRDIKSE